MDEIKVFHDAEARTLTVWVGRPDDERVCEEVGGEVVLMKDGEGAVVGFEKLGFVAATERLRAGGREHFARRARGGAGPMIRPRDGFAHGADGAGTRLPKARVPGLYRWPMMSAALAPHSTRREASGGVISSQTHLLEPASAVAPRNARGDE